MIVAAAVALLPVTAVSAAPEAAASSSLSSSSLLSSFFPFPDDEDEDEDGVDQIIVELDHYGPYELSPDLLSSRLNPENATTEDLVSAAVFSADYEDNTDAKSSALGMLSPARSSEVLAGLTALHHPEITPPEATTPETPIVVLGNGLNHDGSVHPNLENRLAAAEELAEQRPQAPVMVSGGPTATGAVEAEAMRDWLVDRGISEDRIIVEDRANSTVSNARFSRQLLPEASSVIVVTSENHIHRAVMNFTLAFGPTATVAGVGALNDPVTPLPGTLGSYRDALNWYLG